MMEGKYMITTSKEYEKMVMLTVLEEAKKHAAGTMLQLIEKHEEILNGENFLSNVTMKDMMNRKKMLYQVIEPVFTQHDINFDEVRKSATIQNDIFREGGRSRVKDEEYIM